MILELSLLKNHLEELFISTIIRLYDDVYCSYFRKKNVLSWFYLIDFSNQPHMRSHEFQKALYHNGLKNESNSEGAFLFHAF